MGYNDEHWMDKRQLASRATQHIKLMEKMFSEQTKSSAQNTVVYDDTCRFKKLFIKEPVSIHVESIDSVRAILKYAADYKTAVLNFASYKNPGGMFLEGSKAQEECLCHRSNLYGVLVKLKEYYAWNNEHKNKALYLNRGLYTPGIYFSNGCKTRLCDVITCAAPNKSAAQKYCHVSDAENMEVLKSRIKFVLDIAADNGVDTLILGAYGCGVFGQDATEVASIFKELLETEYRYCYSNVVFAIPKGNNGNYEKFAKVFAGLF